MSSTQHLRSTSFWLSLAWLGVGIVGIILPWIQRIQAIPVLRFDGDEFQHTHSAWYLAQGFVPYRDYFEHHTPLLYFHLEPLLAYLKPESSVSAAIDTLVVLRGIMGLWCGLILVGVVFLGRQWRLRQGGFQVGITAAAFLCSIPMFWHKAVEIRPDVPATALLVFGILALQSGLVTPFPCAGAEKGSILNGTIIRCVLGGTLIAAAALFTQKVVFPGLGISLFGMWYVVDNRWGSSRRERVKRTAFAVLGAALPSIMVLMWFWMHDALLPFLWFNINFNLAWSARLSPLKYAAQLFHSSPWFVALVCIGVLRRLVTCWLRTGVRHCEGLISLTAGGAILGLFLLQEPYEQYFLICLPIVAILAAELLVDAVVFIGNSRLLSRTRHSALLAQWFIPVVILLLAHPGIGNNSREHRHLNTTQLANLAWMMEHTSVHDTIFDAWPIYGVFRPHSWFYWSGQRPLRAMIPAAEKAQFEADLLSGKICPTIVARPFLMSKRVLRFVVSHYQKGPDYQEGGHHPPRLWVRSECSRP